MTLMDQFEQAVREREQAERNFNEANEYYIDATIWALNEKEERLRVIIAELKKEPRMAPIEKTTAKFIRKYFITLGVK